MDTIKNINSYELRDPEGTIVRNDFSLFNTKSHLFLNEKSSFNKASVTTGEKLASTLPRTFPPFESEDIDILDYLGRGSFGKVFKAYHRRKNLYLALKFYEVDCSQTFQMAYEEARHEKEILDYLKKSLFHPNIVDVYGLCLKTKKDDASESSKDLYHEGEKQSQILILMLEYGKCSLKDLLDAGRVYDEREVLIIGSKLINALASSQILGISHRDLKPANIILGADNTTFKIADFGLALKLDNPDKPEVELEDSIGTPKYFSPEIRSLTNSAMEKSARYNPYKSDVFSLGMLYKEKEF